MLMQLDRCRAVAEAEADVTKANELLQQCARAEVASQGSDHSGSSLRKLVDSIAKEAWGRIKHIWWLMLRLEWIDAFYEVKVRHMDYHQGVWRVHVSVLNTNAKPRLHSPCHRSASHH